MSRQDVNLWELEKKAIALESEIIDSQGELTPQLESKLDALALEIAERGDEANTVLERLEASELHFKKVAEFYTKAKKASQNAYERLHTKIKQFMADTNNTEIKCDNVTFKLAKAAQLLEIDESQLPEKYKILVTPAPYWAVDKALVKQHLELGVVIPGASLKDNFALRIKAKN